MKIQIAPGLLVTIADNQPERTEGLLNLRWIVGAFQGAIQESYSPGAPRRVEAAGIVNRILVQTEPLLTEAEFYQLQKGFDRE